MLRAELPWAWGSLLAAGFWWASIKTWLTASRLLVLLAAYLPAVAFGRSWVEAQGGLLLGAGALAAALSFAVTASGMVRLLRAEDLAHHRATFAVAQLVVVAASAASLWATSQDSLQALLYAAAAPAALTAAHATWEVLRGEGPRAEATVTLACNLLVAVIAAVHLLG